MAGPVEQPELVIERILTEELVLLTAPWIGNVASLLKRATRGEIDLKILVLRAGCSYRRRLEDILAARGIATPRRLEFGTVDGIVGCVAAGLGVTLLPRAVVERALREGHIVAHALPRKESLVDTLFVRRRDAFVSTALARFLERTSRQA